MRKALLYIAVWGLLVGCRLENNLNPALIGDWVWLGTSGGIGGITYKPAANEQVVLRFGANRQLVVFKNEVELFKGTYKLSTERSIYTGKDSQSVEAQLDGTHPTQTPRLIVSGVINRLTSDELDIGGNYYDGYGSGYQRKK